MTVAELLTRMSSAELSEWMALDLVREQEKDEAARPRNKRTPNLPGGRLNRR